MKNIFIGIALFSSLMGEVDRKMPTWVIPLSSVSSSYSLFLQALTSPKSKLADHEMARFFESHLDKS